MKRISIVKRDQLRAKFPHGSFVVAAGEIAQVFNIASSLIRLRVLRDGVWCGGSQPASSPDIRTATPDEVRTAESALQGVVRLKLSCGTVVRFDSADLPLVWHRWWAGHHSGYATVKERSPVYMHRLILGEPVGLEVDHIDRDRTNNTRANLRACTRTENGWNALPPKKRGSRFRGVYLCTTTGRWRAGINRGSTRLVLGRFDTEVEAARAYNRAALEMSGEFAALNPID